MRTCSVEGCDKKHYGRGYCANHYQLWRRHGNPEKTNRYKDFTPIRGEEWRDIPGCSGRYQVSSLGRIRSYANFGSKYRQNEKAILKKAFANKDGYVKVQIYYDNGKLGSEFLHRLVAKSFIPNPDGLSDVNHKNGDKADNSVDNLEWVSHRDNVIHSIEVLGSKPGHRNKVQCVETGQVFIGYKDAADSVGSTRNEIWKVLSDKKPGRATCGGYHWKRIG